MKKTIYIVDDSADLLEVLEAFIEHEEDLEVCGVSETAAAALEAVPLLNPDLVLTDLSLPGLDGIEFIKRLLVMRPEQWVAILSGHPQTFYAKQAFAAGARGYLLKAEPKNIIQGIRHVLSGHIYNSRSSPPGELHV